MVDHFLETQEYDQSENLGLVHLKGAASVKRMTSIYKFCWLAGQGPAPPLSRPPNQNSWIRHRRVTCEAVSTNVCVSLPLL